MALTLRDKKIHRRYVATMAMLFHESGRVAVQNNETVAAAATQPFTEWPDLTLRVRAGRILTVRNLIDYLDFIPRDDANALQTAGYDDLIRGLDMPTIDAERLAEAIHECERDTVELGLTRHGIGRPWTRWADLPAAAKDGRRRQAEFFISRFVAVMFFDMQTIVKDMEERHQRRSGA